MFWLSILCCCDMFNFLFFLVVFCFVIYFFFQAEDGIRDWSVTGVQTCALPIFTMTDNMGVKEEIELIVEFDIDAVKAVLRRAVPTAAVEPIPAGINTVVLTGTVAHAEDIELILRVAQGVLVSGVPAVAAAQNQAIVPITIVNAMTVGGLRQVQLDVTIASVNRTELRQLGTNFTINGNSGFLTNLINNLAIHGPD